jgi:hypothetical protein
LDFFPEMTERKGGRVSHTFAPLKLDPILIFLNSEVISQVRKSRAI